jgi:hypothetical protein
MSYFGTYSKLINTLVSDFEIKHSPQIYEIELGEPEVNPLDTLVTSEQIWKDGRDLVKMNEFYALSLVGPQGSGKSSIARQVCEFAKNNDFRIIYAMPEDYMNDVNAWLELVTEKMRAKTLIVLDDLSYSTDTQNRKNQALLKNMISRVRHIFKGEIFMIYITHRLHATPPMLRNSASWIFTNMQSADRDDALEIIGRNKILRERLESIFSFISRVSLESAKDRNIKYTFRDNEYNFKWGDKLDSGDGRLMAIYHGGTLKIFHSQNIDVSINFEDYRYIPIPKIVTNGT